MGKTLLALGNGPKKLCVTRRYKITYHREHLVAIQSQPCHLVGRTVQVPCRAGQNKTIGCRMLTYTELCEVVLDVGLL